MLCQKLKFVVQKQTMPTVHLLIKGKVQGVFYRASAKEVADELQLTGWVKNTSDGDVEAMVSGSNEQLQQFLIWCKNGPARAVVNDVQVTFKEEEQFDTFKIAR
jgi:acylphosphatase